MPLPNTTTFPAMSILADERAPASGAKSLQQWSSRLPARPARKSESVLQGKLLAGITRIEAGSPAFGLAMFVFRLKSTNDG